MDRKKRERMKRAAYRSKPRIMWQKLKGEKKKKDIEWEHDVVTGYFYAPYMPILRDTTGIIIAGTTA